MKKIIALALLASSVAPAFAADTGFYVGGNLGVSSTHTGETMTHSADAAYGFTAGYQFTKNLGVEGFYERAGQFSGVNAAGNASGNGRANAFGVMGVGTINVYKAFSLYGNWVLRTPRRRRQATAPSDRLISTPREIHSHTG